MNEMKEKNLYPKGKETNKSVIRNNFQDLSNQY